MWTTTPSLLMNDIWIFKARTHFKFKYTDHNNNWHFEGRRTDRSPTNQVKNEQSNRLISQSALWPARLIIMRYLHATDSISTVMCQPAILYRCQNVSGNFGGMTLNRITWFARVCSRIDLLVRSCPRIERACLASLAGCIFYFTSYFPSLLLPFKVVFLQHCS